MRSPVDLVELPYVFSQVPLLMPGQFVRLASQRGVTVTVQQLEELHKLRLLVPLLRVARNRREVAKAMRQDEPWAWQMAHWDPATTADLVEAREAGRLHDPGVERFIGRAQRQRDAGGRTYASSVYLYSQHQMISLPILRDALPFVRSASPDATKPTRLEVARPWRGLWLNQSDALRNVAIAASALEAPYWVSVLGVLRLPFGEDAQQFENWRAKRPIKSALTWLDVGPGWLTDTAAGLLRTADRIDPLGPWRELVAHASPEKWLQLRGDARVAIDLRTTAELFLLYYEDLATARQARRLDRPGTSNRGHFAHRLKRRRSLDQVLTDFGLSPHPRLVLVVEGDTELLLVPRVLRLTATETTEDVISVQNAESVGADLGPLMSFVAPRLLESTQHPDYLDLERPPTRVLVVFDPERPVADDAAREKRRQLWIDRILRTMPAEHRTEAVRSQIDLLVKVTTWNRKQESFEFAHFTDLQIARAIVSLPGHRKDRSVEEVRRHVERTRQHNENLKSLIPRGSKIDLADALWPVLERRIKQAITRGTEQGIPIVRVLDEAVQLAYEFPRQGLVIGLRPRL